MDESTQDTDQDTAQVIQPAPRLRELSNGAVYDLDQKRIVANPGGGKAAITHATTQDMHRRKRELAQRAILDGIMDGAAASTWKGGVRNMAGAMARLAMTGEGVASVNAFQRLLQGAGLWQDAPAETGGGSQTMVIVGDELARAIMDRLRGDNG